MSITVLGRVESEQAASTDEDTDVPDLVEADREQQDFRAAVERLSLADVSVIVVAGHLPAAVANRIGIEPGSPLASRVAWAAREMLSAADRERSRLLGVADGRFPF